LTPKNFDLMALILLRNQKAGRELVEQRGIEPLTSALRTAKVRFSWDHFFGLENRDF
jgi:hypothetical protein